MALIELLVVLAAGMQFQVCRLRICTSKTVCFIVGNVCICFKNEKKNILEQFTRLWRYIDKQCL